MAKAQKQEDTLVEFHIPTELRFYITPLVILLTTLIVSVSIIWGTKDGVTLNASVESSSSDSSNEQLASIRVGNIIGDFETFTEYDNTVCTQGGKPAVFMFSATWCPHCERVGPVFEDWANEQEDLAVYRYETDTGDNPLTPEVEREIPEDHLSLFRKYNPGGSVPTYVFGCKYARIGNGFRDGLDREFSTFEAVGNELLAL